MRARIIWLSRNLATFQQMAKNFTKLVDILLNLIARNRRLKLAMWLLATYVTFWATSALNFIFEFITTLFLILFIFFCNCTFKAYFTCLQSIFSLCFATFIIPQFLLSFLVFYFLFKNNLQVTRFTYFKRNFLIILNCLLKSIYAFSLLSNSTLRFKIRNYDACLLLKK